MRLPGQTRQHAHCALQTTTLLAFLHYIHLASRVKWLYKSGNLFVHILRFRQLVPHVFDKNMVVIHSSISDLTDVWYTMIDMIPMERSVDIWLAFYRLDWCHYMTHSTALQYRKLRWVDHGHVCYVVMPQSRHLFTVCYMVRPIPIVITAFIKAVTLFSHFMFWLKYAYNHF